MVKAGQRGRYGTDEAKDHRLWWTNQNAKDQKNVHRNWPRKYQVSSVRSIYCSSPALFYLDSRECLSPSFSFYWWCLSLLRYTCFQVGFLIVSQTALQNEYPGSSSGVFQLVWSPFGLVHSLNPPYGNSSHVTFLFLWTYLMWCAKGNIRISSIQFLTEPGD